MALIGQIFIITVLVGFCLLLIYKNIYSEDDSQKKMEKYYMVAQTIKGKFVGLFTQDEIISQFKQGLLSGNYVIAESDVKNLSYNELLKADEVTWITVRDFVAPNTSTENSGVDNKNESAISSISCPVCNNLCSTQAAACPKCGHPINSTNHNVKVENDNSTLPNQPSAGSVLRGILWIFFVISIIYAFGAIKIYNDIPLPIVSLPVIGSHGNEDEILGYKIAIAYHIAPLILMIIVLAITYSAKERK